MGHLLESSSFLKTFGLNARAPEVLPPPQVLVSRSLNSPMDFRPCETLFFRDNFLTLELIGFNFRHEPFQLNRQFLSIWFVNEKPKFGVLVVGP